MQKRYLLTGGQLATSHRVAVRQVQWCDGVVGQQLTASLERGAGLVDIAGVEQREGLVESGLR